MESFVSQAECIGKVNDTWELLAVGPQTNPLKPGVILHF